MSAINLSTHSFTQSPDFFRVYGPKIASATTTLSLGLACLSKFVFNSNPWTAGFMVLGALPGVHFGKKLYTDWIPECLRMVKNEIVRMTTGVPNAKLGLDGWQEDSTHCSYFNQELANQLIKMCKQNQFTTSVDFDCGGKGQYAQALRDSGIEAEGVDFSLASETKEIAHTAISITFSGKDYDFVTSFDVISKVLPGQEREFAQKLIHATKEGGMIVISFAAPGQFGPYCNRLETDKVRSLFEQKGCTYNQEATFRLRNGVYGVHTWLNQNIMVFNKNT